MAPAASRADVVRYRVTGMDCPSCAAKIGKAARAVAGVAEVKVSIASQVMTLRTSDAGMRLPEARTDLREAAPALVAPV